MTPTMAAATTALTTEPTPALATNESGDDVIPFGLIYQAADALWHVNTSGESERILEQFRTSVYDGPAVSPNGAQVLYTEAGDIWLADIVTGERGNLTQTLDRFECCAQWWPGRSDVILFNSWAKEDEGHNYGFPTVAQLDGSGYHVLDESQVSGALPAPSPDGQAVAYDRTGQPWLYRMDIGPKPFEFDLTPYDPQSDGRLSIVSPAWSPDGTHLAWVVKEGVAEDGNSDWTGVAVFDLAARTAQILHQYESQGVGWPPAPVWSPDGQWLAFVDRSPSKYAGLWVARIDAESELHHLGPGGNPVWSPDGRWLAFQSWVREVGPPVFYALIEIGVWEPSPLDIPVDRHGQLVAWVDLG